MINLKTKVNGFIVIIFILLCNNKIAYSGDVNNQRNKNNYKNNAFEFNIGTFYKGAYAPYQLKENKWTLCNAMFLCNIHNENYGYLIGINYINRIFKNRLDKIQLYLDKEIKIGFQSPKLSEKNRLISYDGGSKKSFITFSVIPMFRYYFPINKKNINIGVGGGFNYAVNQIPSELPDKNSISTQINLEIGYELSKKSKTDMVLSLKHKCTFFGLIGGELKGRQWYSIGLRKWI